jgi:hypothetical protein
LDSEGWPAELEEVEGIIITRLTIANGIHYVHVLD